MTKQENNFDYTSICNLGIYSTLISSLDVDNFIKELYNIKDSQPSVSKSNVGGYQTEINLHHNPKFFPLVKILNNVIIELNSNPNIKIDSLWGNISSFGNFNTCHTHTRSQESISGVIYLSTPKKCGNIVFHNPLNLDEARVFFPKVGLLLLFPNILPHAVEPNLSQEDRISISFNFN